MPMGRRPMPMGLAVLLGSWVGGTRPTCSGGRCPARPETEGQSPQPELATPQACTASDRTTCDEDFLEWSSLEQARAPRLDVGGGSPRTDYFGDGFDADAKCAAGYTFCDRCGWGQRQSYCDWDGDCYCDDDQCRGGATRGCAYKSAATLVMIADQPLLRHVLDGVSVPTEGLWLEFGVFTGNSITEIARRAPVGATVYGFDSFLGLPEDYSRALGKGDLTLGGRVPSVPENVVLVSGWFNESLPAFLRTHSESIAFVHMDCDLFSSTMFVLDTLSSRMRPGTVVVIDDAMTETLSSGREYTNLRVVYELLARGKMRHASWIGVSDGTDEAAFIVL